MNKVILDLGCGKKKRPGTIGVDHSDRHNADVVHDLNTFPYPFEANSVDYIYIDNCLEHLNSPLDVMTELHRILKPEGGVKVIVPYFRSHFAFIDPTHTKFFTVDSFAYYDPNSIICQQYDYNDTRFNIEKIVFNETLKNNIFHKAIMLIANKWPHKYETYLSSIFPLSDITYYLKRHDLKS